MNLNLKGCCTYQSLDFVSIPIRDLMNLNLQNNIQASLEENVSIPIRDLMNLNRYRRRRYSDRRVRFNPY